MSDKSAAAENAYDIAAEEFIKAKKTRKTDEAGYQKAKEKMHTARAKYRQERDKATGVWVEPAPVEAKSSVNNG